MQGLLRSAKCHWSPTVAGCKLLTQTAMNWIFGGGLGYKCDSINLERNSRWKNLRDSEMSLA